MSSDFDNNNANLKTKDDPFDLSSVSLSIEREKLKLETERLQIERERLQAEIKKFELRESGGDNPEDLSFGITAICIVAAVCLLLGGIIGFTSGLDLGRRYTPEPRKLLVSREFLTLMRSVRGYTPPPISSYETPLWIPPRNRTSPETLLLTR